MPDTRNLRWVEISTFSPGLWENADWLMPAGAAQTLLDAYPQPGGGLRAFYRPSALSVSGIADITKERVIGLFARGGLSLRSGVGSAVDRYMMTYSFDAGAGAGSKARPKLYRMDGTNSETTWTQIFVTSGATQFNLATNDNNAPRQTSFKFFRLSSGSPNDQHVIFVVRYTGAATGGPGLYRLNYNDLSAAQKAVEIVSSVTGGPANPSGALVIHQARILVAGGGVAGEQVNYSNPGSETLAAANFIGVEPNQDGSNILALMTLAAGDLLVAKGGAPWVVIQGDITNPVVVPMGQGEHLTGTGEQDLVRLPDGGLVFTTNDGYVWETDGHSFTNLSQQLGSFAQQTDFTGGGSIGFLNQFLFIGRGYVFDIASKSWFRQSGMLGSVFHIETATRTIWGATTTGVSFGLASYEPFMNQARVGTYTWKSAPLRSDDGRQMRIRQVQVAAKSYDANATIAVTVNGVTVTETFAAQGQQVLNFLFNQRGHTLDVQVVPTAGTPSANEAPSIDVVRIGVADGHMISSPFPIT